MILNRRRRKFTPMAFTLSALAASIACGPASSEKLHDQIITAKAAKIQVYIGKAFKRIDDAEKPAYKNLLIARLHVCALVNKLLMENNAEPARKRAAYEIRYGTFTQLSSTLSEDYSKDRQDGFATEARTFIRKKLSRSDSARLQIIFNSCLDIRTGKITHALSNMEKQKTLTAAGE